ncbi:hypothetical protein ACJBQ8_10165, partial [Streptococcus suis]
FRFDEDELTRISLQAGTGFFYQKMDLSIANVGQHSELIHGELKKKNKEFLSILENLRDYAKLNSIYDLIWKIFNEK